jgi:hypothetical protein
VLAVDPQAAVATRAVIRCAVRSRSSTAGGTGGEPGQRGGVEDVADAA